MALVALHDTRPFPGLRLRRCKSFPVLLFGEGQMIDPRWIFIW